MKGIINFTVIKNIDYNNGIHLLHYKADQPLPTIEAGQFTEVRVDNQPNTMLRRPFSFCSVSPQNQEISLLIKEVGHGTITLARQKVDEKVNMILPLGNRFTVPTNKSEKLLLVGGGSGIAPMYFLAQQLHEKGFEHINLLLGFRDKQSACMLDLLNNQTIQSDFCTEDGSLGTKGRVTDHPFMQEVTSFNRVYTCGPDPMMNAISTIATQHNIPCEVSLENRMACGFGVCLCCVAKTDKGNVCTCTEGPVFDSTTLK